LCNSPYGGGGLYLGSASSLINCTIVSNYTPGRGSGIYFDGAGANSVVSNSILYANNGAQIYSAATTNCFWRTCSDIVLASGQGNILNNPLFVDPNNRNYRLSKESPCVNTGGNQDWMMNAGDLDGRRRIDKFSGLVDMGCYEYVPRGTIVTIRGR
jgi:hypothetical protein